MDNNFEERRTHPRQFASRLVRIREVEAICGLKRASIYNAVRLGTFPKPVKIGGRASAWIKHEVEAWVEHRIAVSRRQPCKNSATS